MTAAKDAAREALLPLLRTQASYVQTAANDDLSVILSSGFGVNSINRTSSPLTKPNIENIDNFASTQLMVRLTTIDNARAYEVRINAGDDKWENVGVLTKSRRVLLENLTPGKPAPCGRQNGLLGLERSGFPHVPVRLEALTK